jgi:hypothetical protein
VSLNLLFTTNRAPLSRAIEWRTMSPYSHVDIVLPGSERLLGALPFKGVTIYPLANRMHDATRRLIVTVPRATERTIDQALTQLGRPYDWAGVAGLGIGHRRNWQETDKWFCSELAAWALTADNLHLFPEGIHRVTPGNLLDALRFRHLGISHP